MREPYHERPPASFEKGRRTWLESSYARTLCITFGDRLPSTVCKIIAAGFAQERAVQIIRDAWLRSENTRPASLSMTIEADMVLWAQYMGFEGNRYIKSLSYSSKGGPEVKIFERQGGTPLNIFIAHNHLGVVNIIATTGETVPKIDQKANQWWTILSSPSGPFSFQGRFDASSHFDIVRAVDWNKPGIKGYSFCLRDDTILRIIPDDGNKPVDYDLRGGEFPEFWIRRCAGWRGASAALIIHTNRGRRLALGSSPAPHLPEFHPFNPTYRLLGTLPEDEPCRVFYTAGLQGPGWFFFEKILYYPLNEYIQLHSWLPNTQLSALEYYYTSAKLEGSIITGFLLEYVDGSRRSIGQVRLDYLGTPKKANTETLLIKFLRRKDPGTIPRWYNGIESFDFVNTIPQDEETGRYLRVPMRGRIDWIVCTYESRIAHHQNAEPRDEMRHVLAYEKSRGIARSNPVCRPLSKAFGETKMTPIKIRRGLNGPEIDSARRLQPKGRRW
ncbi:hypothetical protein FAVG1_08920 [Fusarium avenaceum]|nr:hypothetical protein FAVG1_08920 [Fusarium avenaceum]